MEILGLIPARGGSKRLKAKNIRKLNGKPLLAHSIESAIESDVFDKIIVSTDDDEIADIARDYNTEIPFKRPKDLASDEAQIKDVTKHIIDRYKNKGVNYDAVMNILPTSPLRSPEDIRQAVEKFKNKNCDYLVSVTDYRYTPMRALVSDENDQIKPYWLENSSIQNRSDVFARSQDHPDFLADAASFYLVDTESFIQDHTFHGENTVGYYIPPERAIDIDDKFDFQLAELILDEKIATEEIGYDLLSDSRY